jgi:hypothetical protein
MTMLLRAFNVVVPPGGGAKTIEQSFSLPSRIRQMDVVLSGFFFDFLNSDHHIDVIQALAFVRQDSATSGTVSIFCTYSDVNADDSYRGFVKALLIADVEGTVALEAEEGSGPSIPAEFTELMRHPLTDLSSDNSN